MCEISIEVFWVFAYLMNVHLFSHTLLKSLYFSPLTSIIFSFEKPINQVKCMNLFQELYSVPFIYMLILVVILHVLITAVLLLVLKLGSIDPPTLIFPFDTVLVVLGLLPFLINVRNQFVSFHKMT